MNLKNYQYIVVEGPIGAGKTTLARRLTESLQAHPLLELPEENPFLEKFYRDPARYALQTQMFFLFQRMGQLRELAQTDLFKTRVVSDFLLEKDPIFARITLSDDEFKLYQQLYDHVRPQAPVPDLVIYLQAQPETLVERIRKRGVAMESGISEQYLFRLCESYSRFFYHYDAAPLLTVNTEHLNPVARDEDYQLLLKHIENMRGKREYFNLGE
ncbi:deoxynucleoside kinase [Noviherbaspirillum aridicola]|uniref:Deoxyguanosine kinase/deoxyadenosine kinase n=1 Tax=Noviherbaspirillum aridicola TaxID=2849687 RepID=A0ABQ4Q866_9BURK|nr:deoxynucleoside kinase [Noviherbaspirillum aridicola]GIZ53229.1 deoxyguanosine kinase/deoxyadenosine kinase [Noviherbaspirillum aridicola]